MAKEKDTLLCSAQRLSVIGVDGANSSRYGLLRDYPSFVSWGPTVKFRGKIFWCRSRCEVVVSASSDGARKLNHSSHLQVPRWPAALTSSNKLHLSQYTPLFHTFSTQGKEKSNFCGLLCFLHSADCVCFLAGLFFFIKLFAKWVRVLHLPSSCQYLSYKKQLSFSVHDQNVTNKVTQVNKTFTNTNSCRKENKLHPLLPWQIFSLWIWGGGLYHPFLLKTLLELKNSNECAALIHRLTKTKSQVELFHLLIFTIQLKRNVKSILLSTCDSNETVWNKLK